MSDEPTHPSSYTENEDSEVSGDGATGPLADMPVNGNSQLSKADDGTLDTNEPLDELRRILLGDTTQQDAAILDKIDQVANLQVEGQLEEISKALPEAIIWHKTNKSSRLNNALSPTIEETLTLSVQRNPQPIADAIFPVIGPAIRKSIREALKSMMDSVNNVLEHSFSPRSLRWRFEALSTGKKFSEVLLAHTLEYRVEQIFLIERDSGVLIHHVYNDGAKIRDGDVVSGMLGALQTFVKDTLDVSQNAVLDSVDIDGVKIVVEPGPRAILAAEISGIHGPELNERLKVIIENIHLHYGHLLEDFDGDTELCEPMLPELKMGLVTQFKEEEKKPPIAAFAVVGLISVLLAVWLVLSIINYQRWSGYLETLREEPGIVVTETGWKNGKWVLQGLHDPFATHPDELRPENIPADRILSTWEPYLAMDDVSNLRRIKTQLQVPSSVDLTMTNGALVATGVASTQWIQQARERAPFLLGVTSYNDSGLTSDMGQTRTYIENATIIFSQGSNVIEPEQAQVLRQISAAILSLDLDNVVITVNGFTSPEGTEATNQLLSQARSDAVREALVAYGIPRRALLSQGTGGPRANTSATTEEALSQNRSVTFTVGTTD